MPEKPAPRLNAVVTQRIEVASGLIILRVAPEGWSLPAFQAGQYTVLSLPGSAPRCAGSDPEQQPPPPDRPIKRAYSIASSSLGSEYLEFYITLVRSGALTPRLFSLGVGDRLWLSDRIVGVFTLQDVAEESNIVLLATSTGIAPYMSMLRTILSANSRRRIAVVHGARHSWDLGYHAELLTFARMCPWFDYLPIVSRPKEEPIRWGGRAGYCQDIWTDRIIDQVWGLRPTPENTHLFLCGNPAMIQDMLPILSEDGFRQHRKRSPGQVHLEKYW